MKKLFLLSLLAFHIAPAFAQTQIVFTNALMVGTTNDTTINIKADNNPGAWNGTFYYLYQTGTNITTTNGVGAIRLIPGSYTASFAGIPRSFKLYVTNSANALNAADLASQIVFYSGVQNLVGAGGVTIIPPTGGGGNYTISNGPAIGAGVTNLVYTNGASSIAGQTLFENTNYDPFGVAMAATNAIGVGSGLAAFARTNQFDAAGSSTVALANGSNSFSPKNPIYIIVEGDSLSASIAGCSLTNLAWPYQLMSNTVLVGIAQMTNIGLSGDFATNMVNTYTNQARTNIQNAVASGRTVYWMPYAGINDIDQSFGTNVAFSAISNLWLEGRLDGAKVVAFTIPYNYSASSGVLTDTTNYNLMIRNATNLWDYLVEPLHVLKQSDSCDGLHYTIGGNRKLAQEVFESVFGAGSDQRFFGNLSATNIFATGGFPFSQEVDLTAVYKNSSGPTILGAGNTSPTFQAYNSVYFTTNVTAQYIIFEVPYGLGWTNLEISSVWEGEIGATTTAVNDFSLTALRIADSGRATDANITSTFNISAATLTHFTNTVSFSDDMSPRQLIFMLNPGVPFSYGKQKLYLDSLKLKSK